jgi:hypothetical protein
MINPQFNEGGVAIFNKKINLNELRMVDARSLFGLYISQTMLFLGILLILFNSFDVVEPGNYLGVFNWLTVTIFSIGIIINFVSIPFLYYSSLNNFKKESDFWDKETFWIVPLFFFGTFFMYSSKIDTAIALLTVSMLLILVIHLKFLIEARKLFSSGASALITGSERYLVTLQYLGAYYVILLGLTVIFNPLGYMINLIKVYV